MKSRSMEGGYVNEGEFFFFFQNKYEKREEEAKPEDIGY